MTDEQLVDWFDRNPEFAVVVSDHMAWGFYRRPEVLARSARVLFSAEITLCGRFDFLLLAADSTLLDRLEAVDAGSPPGPPRRLGDPPGAALIALLADPRVLVTLAHPHLFGVGPAIDMPEWLLDIPVDFLEYNMTRLATHPRLGASRSSAGAAAAVRDAADRMRRLRDEYFPGSRFVVGSDAHEPRSLGRTYLQLHAPCADAAGVWRAMQQGDFVGHLEVRGAEFAVHPVDGVTDVGPA